MTKAPNERGDVVKAFLNQESLTYGWMLKRLWELGICSDKSELSLALSGYRTSPKALRVLDGCERVIGEYQKIYPKKQVV